MELLSISRNFLTLERAVPSGSVRPQMSKHQKTENKTHSLHNPLKLTEQSHFFLAAAKLLQSCPTLCDPRDGSPPGFPVPGILQARTLEWVAISFSNAWKWKVKVKSLSCGRLLVTPWTAAYQAPRSMVSSRQDYWSGVPLTSLSLLSTGYLLNTYCITRTVVYGAETKMNM